MNDGVSPPETASLPAPESGAARVAFVQSCWHREIVDQARIGFLQAFDTRAVGMSAVDSFEVPGAFEIPLQVKLLAKTGRYAAIVAAGFVVDGGIYRHEFVASAVINALMAVQLETEVPVLSVVLTPQHFHEHEEHRDYFFRHLRLKGEEAAATCSATLIAMAKFRPGSQKPVPGPTEVAEQ